MPNYSCIPCTCRLIRSGEERIKITSFQPRPPSQPLTTVEENESKGEISEPNKRLRNSAFRRQIMQDGGGVGSGAYRRRPIRRNLNPKSKAPGTTYDIVSLINDYRNIILCSNEHNKWIGKLMGGAQAANYAQFVSDVFLMIQVSSIFNELD